MHVAFAPETGAVNDHPRPIELELDLVPSNISSVGLRSKGSHRQPAYPLKAYNEGVGAKLQAAAERRSAKEREQPSRRAAVSVPEDRANVDRKFPSAGRDRQPFCGLRAEWTFKSRAVPVDGCR